MAHNMMTILFGVGEQVNMIDFNLKILQQCAERWLGSIKIEWFLN